MRRWIACAVLAALLLPCLQPAAPPAPPAPPPRSGDAAALAQAHVLLAIHAAAVRWHVSEARLDALARCESNLLPWAYNPGSGAVGVFQFEPATDWAYARTIHETKGPWDAWSAAQVAAYMVASGQAGQWAC